MTLDRVNTPELVRIAALRKKALSTESDLTGFRAELVQAMKDAYPAFTLEEIGQAAGISRQRVQQLLAKEG